MEITFYLVKIMDLVEQLLELMFIIIPLLEQKVLLEFLILPLYIKEQAQADGKLRGSVVF